MGWRIVADHAGRDKTCSLIGCQARGARHLLLAGTSHDTVILCAQHCDPTLGIDVDLQVRDSHQLGTWCLHRQSVWKIGGAGLGDGACLLAIMPGDTAVQKGRVTDATLEAVHA